jgi:hypothetical protein
MTYIIFLKIISHLLHTLKILSHNLLELMDIIFIIKLIHEDKIICQFIL